VNTSSLFAILLVLLLVAGGVAVWIRGEGEPPAIDAPESVLVGRAGATVHVAATDPRSGLRDLRVVVQHAGGELPLLDERFPGNTLSGGVRTAHEADIALDPKALAGLEGDALLRISSRDYSWRDFLSGNETVLRIPLSVDVDPPAVYVSTGLTYVKTGGAGAVVYRISEPVTRDGVRVGEQWFRGYPHPNGQEGERIALYAVPADADAKISLRVVAQDAAGNEGSSGWPVVVQPRPQPTGNVTLPKSFLDDVVPRLAGGPVTDGSTAFHEINTKMRAENEARIRELLAESSPRPLFDGALDQLDNSQVTSRFAERRTYFVDGNAVSKAVHYGYDLAATAAAPITAAAAGRVAYAGELGIYGNCVLLDHGLGLATLYGHLSRIDVQAGSEVSRGQTLGLSGATGLAGGDHLHFAVLVGETYADPLEWWDPSWMVTHVMDKLGVPAP
jgi:murein DD-endopeptidase MepM/ murein hydrolase activator NlpD